MTATCTVTTGTDPISALNEAAVVATGTCTALNTVTVKIVDSAGALVGPVSATVTGTGWSLAATDVSALADGTLIYQATSSDGSASAFAAKAAQKQTAAPGYITVQQLRDALHDPSTTLDTTLMQIAILSASRAVEGFTDRTFYQLQQTRYFSPRPSNLWVLDIDDLVTTSGLAVTVEFGLDGTYPETRTVGTDFIAQPINQTKGGIDGWPYTSLQSVNAKIWPPKYADFQRDTVKIVGTWGWSTIPYPVISATTIVAAFLYKRPEAALGMTALPEIGMMRVRDPDVALTLRPYQRADSLLMA